MEQGAANMKTTEGNGRGLKIATIVACAVAVCGIGFGIYGMVQGSQKNISDLKVQIKEEDGTVTTIETPKIETSAENGTTVTIADSAVRYENPKDYIYVGEWGFKIKKAENWRYSVRSYGYYSGYPQAVDSFEIVAAGGDKAHAIINPSAGICGGDDTTDCVKIKIGDGETVFDVIVPKSAPEEFRNWVMNPDNYSEM